MSLMGWEFAEPPNTLLLFFCLCGPFLHKREISLSGKAALNSRNLKLSSNPYLTEDVANVHMVSVYCTTSLRVHMYSAALL